MQASDASIPHADPLHLTGHTSVQYDHRLTSRHPPGGRVTGDPGNLPPTTPLTDHSSPCLPRCPVATYKRAALTALTGRLNPSVVRRTAHTEQSNIHGSVDTAIVHARLERTHVHTRHWAHSTPARQRRLSTTVTKEAR